MKAISDLMKSIQPVGHRTCEECGSTVPIYEHKGKKSSVCMKCEDIKLQKRAQKAYENKEKRKHESMIRDFEVIPNEIKGATFGGYQPNTNTQRHARDLSMKFVDNEFEETTLFFQGAPGIGKTHLSYCIANACKEQGQAVLFLDCPSLMTIIRGTYNKYSNLSQEQFMKFVQEIDLLILDDIGAEYVKQDPNGLESWAADIIFQIVNSRQGKRNVYTTNYTGDELLQKYGMLSSRIISRLMSNAKVIKVEGNDYRMKGLM